jgi:hypothetical protein
MKSVNSRWDPAIGILFTELRGTVTTDDVRVWRDGLFRKLERNPNQRSFTESRAAEEWLLECDSTHRSNGRRTRHGTA